MGQGDHLVQVEGEGEGEGVVEVGLVLLMEGEEEEEEEGEGEGHRAAGEEREVAGGLVEMEEWFLLLELQPLTSAPQLLHTHTNHTVCRSRL